MKTSLTKISAALALVAMSGAAVAGVSTTRHNLGSGLASGNGTDTGTSEICVFCHTPHGGDQTAIVPLWNRVTTTATFQKYSSLGTGTLDGSDAVDGGIGSISIACLSCHDGTQAMDVVLNAPGFGNGNTINGANVGTGFNTSWADGPQMDGTNSNNANLAAELVYIGTDLRNDHPISIQYGGGNINTGALAVATKDTDFVTPANALTTASNRIWWIDTNGDSTKQKTDLPLYTRAAEPMVECGTCHDPHVNNSTFLRFTTGNANSQVCLACHIK